MELVSLIELAEGRWDLWRLQDDPALTDLGARFFNFSAGSRTAMVRARWPAEFDAEVRARLDATSGVSVKRLEARDGRRTFSPGTRLQHRKRPLELTENLFALSPSPLGPTAQVPMVRVGIWEQGQWHGFLPDHVRVVTGLRVEGEGLYGVELHLAEIAWGQDGLRGRRSLDVDRPGNTVWPVFLSDWSPAHVYVRSESETAPTVTLRHAEPTPAVTARLKRSDVYSRDFDGGSNEQWYASWKSFYGVPLFHRRHDDERRAELVERTRLEHERTNADIDLDPLEHVLDM